MNVIFPRRKTEVNLVQSKEIKGTNNVFVVFFNDEIN